MDALRDFPLNRSIDSFRWHGNPVLERGEPGEWDDDLIRDPMVFYDNTAPREERFRLYYCGRNCRERHFNIGLAYGAGLERLRKYPGNPIIRMTEEWELGSLNHTPYVIQIPGTARFEMIYTAYAKRPAEGLCSLVSVSSIDGKSWDGKKQVLRQITVGGRTYHPQKPILHYNVEESRYYLIFSGSLMRDSHSKNEGFVGLAVSDDGEQYTFDKIVIPQDAAGSIYDSHGLVTLAGWHFLLVTHDSACAHDGDGNDGYPERWFCSRDMREWYGSPKRIFDTYPDDGALYSHVSPLLTEAGFAYFVYDYGEPNRFGLVKLPLNGKPSTIILEAPRLGSGEGTQIADCYPAICLDDKNRFGLTVEVEYHPNSASPVTIHVHTSYDGSNWDTEELTGESGIPAFGALPVTPGKLIRITRTVAVNARYVKVTAKNNDERHPVKRLKVTATL